MPLSQGCILYLIIMELTGTADKKVLPPILIKIIAFVLAIGLYKDTITHLNYCNRFYYTDEWIYQYDVRLAAKVCEDIREVQYANHLDFSYEKVLFLGYPDVPYNSVCLRGHTNGVSAFRQDSKYIERSRIVYFLRNLGYPTDDYGKDGKFADYNAYFEEYFGQRVDGMPYYPEPGYVQYMTDTETGLEYIVVKLGVDWRNVY